MIFTTKDIITLDCLQKIIFFKNETHKALKKYYNENSILIVKIENELNEEFQKLKNEAGDEKLGELYSSWQCDYQERYINFKNFVIKSLLLATFSFFESFLLELARIGKEQLGSKKEVSAIKGSDIEKPFKYLKRIIGIKLAERETQIMWNSIKDFQVIRNAIIHNNYLLFTPFNIKGLSKLKALQEKYSEISLDNNNELSISDMKYILNFVEIANLFLDQVLKELNQRLITREIKKSTINTRIKVLWNKLITKT